MWSTSCTPSAPMTCGPQYQAHSVAGLQRRNAGPWVLFSMGSSLEVRPGLASCDGSSSTSTEAWFQWRFDQKYLYYAFGKLNLQILRPPKVSRWWNIYQSLAFPRLWNFDSGIRKYLETCYLGAISLDMVVWVPFSLVAPSRMLRPWSATPDLLSIAVLTPKLNHWTMPSNHHLVISFTHIQSLSSIGLFKWSVLPSDKQMLRTLTISLLADIHFISQVLLDLFGQRTRVFNTWFKA